MDDHMIMRNFLERSSTDLGFRNFEFAADGIEALEKYKSQDFDIILADWNMPNLSGIDLLKTIREQETDKKVAFVMVTAEGEKHRMLEAMTAGATAYIAKPFSEETYKDTIEKVITWLENNA